MLKKKRVLSILFTLLFIFMALGSGGSTDASKTNSESDQTENQLTNNKGKEKVYIDDDEIQYIYSDVRKYVGKHVMMTGQIFIEPERDGKQIAIQMFQKPENSENNTVVIYTGEIDVEDGDYIRIDGVIEGEVKGMNAFGGEINAPKIMADKLEILTYQDVMAPTVKELVVDETQDQYGYEVIVDKIELAESETRVYVTINNNGDSSFSVYSFSSKLLQGRDQFEEESKWEADYPEIQSDLKPGVSTNGILCFPAINHEENFTLYIDGHSDNWEEDIEEYVFEIENN